MLNMIIGTGITTLILMLLCFSLDKKHFILKLLTTFFILLLLSSVQTSLLTPQICTNEILNYSVSGSTTINNYGVVCNNGILDNTRLRAYKTYILYVKLFYIYIFVYLIYVSLDFFGKLTTIKRKLNNINFKNKK